MASESRYTNVQGGWSKDTYQRVKARLIDRYGCDNNLANAYMRIYGPVIQKQRNANGMNGVYRVMAKPEGPPSFCKEKGQSRHFHMVMGYIHQTAREAGCTWEQGHAFVDEMGPAVLEYMYEVKSTHKTMRMVDDALDGFAQKCANGSPEYRSEDTPPLPQQKAPKVPTLKDLLRKGGLDS